MSYETEVRKEEDRMLKEGVRWRVLHAIKIQKYEMRPKDSKGCAVGYSRAKADLLKLLRNLPL